MFNWSHLNRVPHSQNTMTESETERKRIAIRQLLVNGIRDVVKQHGMTHGQASFESRMGRTVITAILNGKLEKISTDRLLRIAIRLGLRIELKISPKTN